MNDEPQSEAHYMSVKEPVELDPAAARKQLDKMIASGKVEEETLVDLFAKAFAPAPVRQIQVNTRGPISKLSEEERDARRALKRHKRVRAAEALSARQRGQGEGLRRAKRVNKKKNSVRCTNPEIKHPHRVAREVVKIEGELVGLIAKNIIKVPGFTHGT